MKPRALTVCVVGSLLLPACGEGIGRGACFPERLRVVPPTVLAGGTVELSAPPADCSIGGRDGVGYRIRFMAFRGTPVEIASVTPDAFGAFSIEVTVPDDAPPGPAHFEVIGSTLDRCDDSDECAGYSAEITIGS